jgi:uncharacterized membrane protein YfcA
VKLDRKLKRRIALGIAILLILYGILGQFINFNVDPKLDREVSMVLLIVAFAMLFSDKRQKPSETDNAANTANTAETEPAEPEKLIEDASTEDEDLIENHTDDDKKEE